MKNQTYHHLHLKSAALKESIRIGYSIIDNAVLVPEGLCWHTLSAERREDQTVAISKSANEDIYHGVSGILLFLKELHKQTQIEKFWLALIDGGRWLSNYLQSNEAGAFAFITGRLGSALTLYQVGEYLGDRDFKSIAVQAAKKLSNSVDAGEYPVEYLNGLAGSAWGLLLFYSYTKDPFFFKVLQDLVQKIVEKVCFANNGCYWDRNHFQVRPLCGFSHGVSGIAALFAELYACFQLPLFKQLAASGFAYENRHFDRQAGQWPDFRKMAFDAEELRNNEQAYDTGNLAYFNKVNFMSAWCHGNIGIGLAQTRAANIDRLIVSRDYARKALHMHIKRGHECKDHVSAVSYTLCHGFGGNLELFLEPFVQSDSPLLKKYIDTAVGKILANREKKQFYQSGYAASMEEDDSLLVGNAGIGYFLLRFCDPKNVPSILYPAINMTFDGTSNQGWNLLSFADLLLLKQFPRTVEMLNSLRIDTVGLCVKLNAMNAYKLKDVDFLVRQWIQQELTDKKQCKQTLKILEFEKFKCKAEEEINNVFAYTQSAVRAKQVNCFLNEPDRRIKLNDAVKIFKIAKANKAATYTENFEFHRIAVITGYNGAEEVELSEIAYLIIRQFGKERHYQEGLKNLISFFDPAELKSKNQEIIYYIKQHILTLLRQELLIIAG